MFPVPPQMPVSSQFGNLNFPMPPLSTMGITQLAPPPTTMSFNSVPVPSPLVPPTTSVYDDQAKFQQMSSNYQTPVSTVNYGQPPGY